MRFGGSLDTPYRAEFVRGHHWRAEGGLARVRHDFLDVRGWGGGGGLRVKS